MSAEHVGYRFSREELAALKLLLSLPAIRGLNLPELDETDYHSAVQSLTDAGVVMPAGEKMGVDRLSAVIVTAMSGRRCLRLHSEGRDTLLYPTRVLHILADAPRTGMLTLTPAKTLSEAKALLTDELARHGEKSSLELMDADGEIAETRAIDGRDALMYALDELCRALETSDPNPSER